jgi:hypothetical protein
MAVRTLLVVARCDRRRFPMPETKSKWQDLASIRREAETLVMIAPITHTPILS